MTSQQQAEVKLCTYIPTIKVQVANAIVSAAQTDDSIPPEEEQIRTDQKDKKPKVKIPKYAFSFDTYMCWVVKYSP